MVSIIARERSSLDASLKRLGLAGFPRRLARIGRALRERWARLCYAWRILRDGGCDGCSLGSSGLRDWTTRKLHVCGRRLGRLRLDVMPPMDLTAVEDADALRARSGAELRRMGRLPTPLLRRRGERGFHPVGWDAALDLVAARIRASSPRRLAFLLSGGGLANETCYVAQKAARALGIASVDCAGRASDAPGGLGLRQALGVDASTCSFEDWMRTDLIVLVGANVVGSHPWSRRYLRRARRAGARVAVVEICREQGAEPSGLSSALQSALFGSKEADRYFLVDDGGEVAFLNGALKHLLERSLVDRAFVGGNTSGIDAVERELAGQGWEQLEGASGAERGEMAALAEMIGGARRAVFAWDAGPASMGPAEDAPRALANLALARGFVGREGCGLMPLPGPDFALGGDALGAGSAVLPGGAAVGLRGARRLSALWGFKVPARRGLAAPEMIDAARRGRLDMLFLAGGDLAGLRAAPAALDAALAQVPLRVHLDVALSGPMLAAPAEAVLLLPATTRHETAGGVTGLSAERRVAFSPEIPGPRAAQARDAWRVFAELAARVRPDRAGALQFADAAAIRREIATAVPSFACIEVLAKKGDHFQVGGPRLCGAGRFPTADGKAHLQPVPIPVGERGAARLLPPEGGAAVGPDGSHPEVARAGDPAARAVLRRAKRARGARQGEARDPAPIPRKGAAPADAQRADPGR